MAQNPNAALFCDNIGNTTHALRCCYPNDQNSQICHDNFFNSSIPTFDYVCPQGHCIEKCQDTKALYFSLNQDTAYEGNGFGPRRRYLTCANVPAMAGYLSQNGVLQPNISEQVGRYIDKDVSDEGLNNITRAVTECWTQTCRSARNNTDCSSKCSGANLILNNTTPNIEGLNGCLDSLCNGRYNSLPFADADIVGIGVFASYIMQCMFVVILWFGLLGFELYNHHRRKHPRTHKTISDKHEGTHSPDDESSDKFAGSSHQTVFENFLVQFHKAQCYFSATIQIASLSYGIFETDMLITFMLTPLATNGVLPVVFAFVLLFRCGKSTMDVTLLTVACWFLSSLVYWILYANIIPINQKITSDQAKYRAYQQFMYKLSAIPACGGYSALAACPSNFVLGREDIFAASHNLRVLTPIIWSFSTACLLVVLAGKLMKWRRTQNDGKTQPVHTSEVEAEAAENAEERAQYTNHPNAREFPPFFQSGLGGTVTYWLVTACFLAGIGMQLSLLSISTSLNMMNRTRWDFGQIVAITVWAPPLLGYLYDELKKIMKVRFNVGNLPK